MVRLTALTDIDPYLRKLLSKKKKAMELEISDSERFTFTQRSQLGAFNDIENNGSRHFFELWTALKGG